MSRVRRASFVVRVVRSSSGWRRGEETLTGMEAIDRILMGMLRKIPGSAADRARARRDDGSLSRRQRKQAER